MRYILLTVLIVYIVSVLIVYALDRIAHKTGLVKLIIMQRYFEGKITDEEIDQYKRDH